MHLVNCKHPRVITNPYTHTSMYVPCGCCSVCKQRYNLRWRSRLEQEFKDNKYGLFITLTYNESKVPLAHYDNNELYSDDFGVYKIPEQILNDDIQRSFIEQRGSLPHASKSDIQKFIKRIRNTYRNEQIRYYIVAEYGPRTYRPHYHGILFFDSEYVAQTIRKTVRNKWQLGYTDTKFANVCSAKYVSEYCSSAARLPFIYQTPMFRPFVLASRRNPIGYKYFRLSDYRDTFASATPTYIAKGPHGESEEVLPEFIRHKLYPKCKGYREMPSDVRKLVYGRHWYSPHVNFKFILKNSTEKGLFVLETVSQITIGEKLYECNEVIYRDEMTVGGYLLLLSLGDRVLNLCKEYSICFDDYFINLELFHNRYDAWLLKEQVQFEEHFSRCEKNGNLSPLWHLYQNNLLDRSNPYKLMEHHGYDYLSLDYADYDYRITDDYKGMCEVADSCEDKGIVVKSHNDLKSYKKCKSLLGYSDDYFGST